MFARFVTILPLLFGVLVEGYANPGACSGACWAHDPSVIQRTSDGAYFKFNTGGGIEIVKATSLSGPWTILGKALPSGSKIALAGNTDLWAPDVQKVGNLYHMYYAVSQFGSQNSAIGLATSPTLEPGTWTDLGSTGIASSPGKAYNAIDPNLINAAGTYYLTFGSFWHDIYQVKMDASAKTKGSNSAYNIAYNSTGTSAQEGPYMFYHSGYYFLLWSSGICCGYDTAFPKPGAEYQIMMCRSTSPSGPFVDRTGKACTSNGGSPLLTTHGNVYGPGGQGVFTDSKLGLVLYYHYADKTGAIGDGAYKFGWNALTWSTNGWPVV